MKIRFEDSIDRHVLGIGVNKRLVIIQALQVITLKGAEQISDEDCGEGNGENISYLASALLKIDGVSAVFIYPYSITIEKGICFEWEDIIPKIREAIKWTIGESKELEELPKIEISDLDAKKVQRQVTILKELLNQIEDQFYEEDAFSEETD